MLKENKPFSRKILIFTNFSPLVAVEYIKIFKNLFDFVKAHIKRQLYFAVRWHDSIFFCTGIHSTLLFKPSSLENSRDNRDMGMFDLRVSFEKIRVVKDFLSKYIDVCHLLPATSDSPHVYGDDIDRHKVV